MAVGPASWDTAHRARATLVGLGVELERLKAWVDPEVPEIVELVERGRSAYAQAESAAAWLARQAEQRAPKVQTLPQRTGPSFRERWRVAKEQLA